jgi:hypothetical protein
MGQGVQFFFGMSHCTQHTIAVCSVLIALWDFLMQLKLKGHWVSLGFVLVSIPIHTWDFCAMEIKGLFGFIKFSVNFFPTTTVHNMRLLCNWNQRLQFVSFHRALCYWGVFFFVSPLYIQQSRLFTQSKLNVVFLGCCVAFLHSVQKTQWSKNKIKFVVKHKFGKKNPRVFCPSCFLTSKCEKLKKMSEMNNKTQIPGPTLLLQYYYYYHTIQLLFMLLRCNFQSKNLETPLP